MQVRLLAICAGAAIAFGDTLTQRYGSDLLPLRLLFSHKPAVPIDEAAGRSEVFLRALPGSRLLPDQDAPFVHSSVVLVKLASAEAARCILTVLVRSSNRYLSGNCDSLRLETRLNYLTRLGTVSDRS